MQFQLYQMKRALFLLAFLCSTFSLSGQQTFAHSILANLAISKTTEDNEGANKILNSPLGVSFSAMFQTTDNPYANIRLGVRYSYFRLEGRDRIEYDDYILGFVSGYFDFSASHHQVSLPFEIVFSPLPIPFIFKGGAELVHPFSGEVSTHNFLQARDDGTVIEDRDSLYSYSKSLKNTFGNYYFGVGYFFQLFSKSWEVNLQYYKKFNSIFKSGDAPLERFEGENGRPNEILVSLGLKL